MYDLILQNGKIADLQNDKLISGADVAIADGKIVKIGKIERSAKNVVDCEGKIIAPGFIDAHVHIESGMATPKEFGKSVLPHGTTTVIADPHEIVNVGGKDALDTFLEMTDDAPIDIFTVIPSSVPATPFDTNGAGEFTAEDMKKYVSDRRIVGLGEVMCYNEVLACGPSIYKKIELFKGKTIDGHTAGLPSEKISAYAAAGIANDHECVTFEDAKLRIENGLNVYIREGSAARNAKDILSGLKKYNDSALCEGEYPLPLSKFAFCTDDKHLSTIDKEGHINHIADIAVKCGFSIFDALKMASLNAARFYSLNDRGEIKEGKKADLVVFGENSISNIDFVVKDGRIAGKSKVVEANNKYLQNSLRYRDFSAEDFALRQGFEYAAIKLTEGQLLTYKENVKFDKAMNVVATIERYGKNGNYSVCPIIGYGIKDGAVATSVSHDSHNVVVAGDNGVDMAVAVNRLKEIGGGYIITSSGKILGELPLDIAGLMSSESADMIKSKLTEMESIAEKLGINPKIDAFTTLSFVALPVIPFVRLLDTGLFDVIKSEFIKQ